MGYVYHALKFQKFEVLEFLKAVIILHVRVFGLKCSKARKSASL